MIIKSTHKLESFGNLTNSKFIKTLGVTIFYFSAFLAPSTLLSEKSTDSSCTEPVLSNLNEESFSELALQANLGNPLAQRKLGCAYEFGYYARQNYVAAYFYHSLSASHGNKASRESMHALSRSMTKEELSNARALISDWRVLDPILLLFSLADSGDHKSILELFINKPNTKAKLDVDINTQDEDGWSALHFAAAKGHLDTVQLLLRNGADVDLAAKDGATPLMLATHTRSLDVVKHLVENGANINKNTAQELNADLISEFKNDEVKKFIKMSNKELTIELQTLLQDFGYNTGKPDGVLGRRTVASIRDFQMDYSLPITGEVSQNLLVLARKISSETKYWFGLEFAGDYIYKGKNPQEAKDRAKRLDPYCKRIDGCKFVSFNSCISFRDDKTLYTSSTKGEVSENRWYERCEAMDCKIFSHEKPYTLCATPKGKLIISTEANQNIWLTADHLLR